MIADVDSTTITPPRSGLLRRPLRNFVGRQTECERCWAELNTPLVNGGRFIVSVAGVGGIGKTTLVERLSHVAMSGALQIWVDERSRISTPSDIATVCAEQMATALGPTSQCAAVLDELASSGLPRASTSTQPARRLLDDATSRLTAALIRDINHAHRKVVLILDSYEVLRSIAGPWLLDGFLSGSLGPVTGDVRLIISGREPLQRTDPRWIRDWDTAILNFDLQPFSRGEIEAFLRGGPEATSVSLAPSMEEVTRAAEVTGGLPVWLGLWRQAWLRDGDAPEVVSAEDVLSVVERFLMWWPDAHQRAWVRSAWVPRWFNLEVLRVLIGDDAELAFEWLTAQASIVRGVGGRWSFHQVVRTALHHETIQRTPGDLARLHDRLAAFWATLKPSPTRRHEEELYHLLLGSKPSDGIAATYQAYVRSLAQGGRGASVIVAAAVDARSDLASTAALPALGALDLHWLAYQAGPSASQQLGAARDRILGLGVLPPAERAILLANKVDDQADSGAQTHASNTRRRPWWARLLPAGRLRLRPQRADTQTLQRARGLIEYGDTLRMAGKYGEALVTLERALEVDSRSPQAHASRGETLRVLGRFGEAIDELSVATRLAPNEAWVWSARAAAYLAVNNPSSALADAERALTLERENAWTLAVRGLALAGVAGGPVPPAIAALRRALELDPSLDWVGDTLANWERA